LPFHLLILVASIVCFKRISVSQKLNWLLIVKWRWPWDWSDKFSSS